MTLLSHILSFFPAFILVTAGVSLLYFIDSPDILSFLTFLFSLYGLPLLAYHCHQRFYPVQEGVSYLRGQSYSAWWGSHQIQATYIAFPILEIILRLIPGLFSLWLRLWGAHIGREVYWTSLLEIADRGLLEIGDRVVFGHRVGLYAHVIKPRKKNLMLFVKKITIGNDVFIGAKSQLGPGVIIGDHSYLPAETTMYPNQQVNSCES